MAEQSGRAVSQGQTFQAFWFGQLTACERLCIKSFLDNGHRYILYSYDRDVDVPAGTEIADAGQIYPRDRVFFYANGSVSAFSNMFRWRLLYEKGGWWVDTDVVCLSPLLPQPAVFFAWEDEQRIGSAILKFPAGHPVVGACLDRSERLGSKLVRWGETGPAALTEYVLAATLQGKAAPTKRVYPLHYREALDALAPQLGQELIGRLHGADFYHIWHEIIRRHAAPKQAPPPGSLLWQLFHRHGVEAEPATATGAPC
jgi:hypothetical protein